MLVYQRVSQEMGIPSKATHLLWEKQVSDRPTPQAESQPGVFYDASSDAGTIEVWTPSAQPHSTRKDEDFS